ncbi:MAG: DUF3024 domain-containing protein [Microcystis sp. LE19-196.1B]|nr:DUF3024 domain-containing protein [Microcystis sp. LE19-196.1B]
MFSQKEVIRIEKAMLDLFANRRPAPDLRHKIDINYKIERNSVEIYSIRPQWNDSLNIIESPIAKTTFIQKEKIWKIYWQRADLKWHPYEPRLEVPDIQDFIEIVNEDEFGCFWG